MHDAEEKDGEQRILLEELEELEYKTAEGLSEDEYLFKMRETDKLNLRLLSLWLSIMVKNLGMRQSHYTGC